MIETPNTCWICKGRLAASSASISVKMYGNAKYGETSNYVLAKTRDVKFQSCEIIVPRCEQCKRSDQGSHFIGLLTVLGLMGISYYVSTSWLELTAPLSYVTAVLAGALAWVAVIIASIFLFPSAPAPIQSNFFGSYPPIMEKVAQGWEFGDGPPNSIRL